MIDSLGDSRSSSKVVKVREQCLELFKLVQINEFNENFLESFLVLVARGVMNMDVGRGTYLLSGLGVVSLCRRCCSMQLCSLIGNEAL